MTQCPSSCHIYVSITYLLVRLEKAEICLMSQRTLSFEPIRRCVYHRLHPCTTFDVTCFPYLSEHPLSFQATHYLPMLHPPGEAGVPARPVPASAVRADRGGGQGQAVQPVLLARPHQHGVRPGRHPHQQPPQRRGEGEILGNLIFCAVHISRKSDLDLRGHKFVHL